jgi:uncharacterized protein YukE
MDDLISARFAEIQGGASELGAGTNMRQDMLDENHSSHMGLSAAWDDAVYDQATVDHQFNYNMHTEDIALNHQTAQAMNQNVENYADAQQRCMGGYAR